MVGAVLGLKYQELARVWSRTTGQSNRDQQWYTSFEIGNRGDQETIPSDANRQETGAA